MTVIISKPSINIREKIAELEKPSGIAGESVLRADSVQDVRDQLRVGRKNLLINGSFDVWQRGTSITDTTNGPYNYITADHWVTYYTGTYAQTDVALPNGVNAKGLKFTTASSAPNFNCPIEDGGKILKGRTITFSWWMRASKAFSNIKSRVNNVGNGTYGASQYDVGIVTYQSNDVTTEWTHHTYTVTLPDALTYDHINAEIWGFNDDWSNGDWFEFTQVQLELGSVATDFEQRSYAEELALCQRYFLRIKTAGLVYNTYSTTQGYFQIPLPVAMRGHPSASWDTVDRVALASSSNINTNITYWASYSAYPSSFYSFQARSSVSLTAGSSYVVFPTNTPYLSLSEQI